MPVETELVIDEVDTDERDDVAAEAEAADEADVADAADQRADAPAERVSRSRWARLLAYWVLPGSALILAGTAGYLKWTEESVQLQQAAATESVQAATSSTIAMLSYRPETVDKDLTAATDRLTGDFRDQYTQLVRSVVAPGAKQQHISAAATVPVAAVVSATPTHAVVLLAINQTTTIGNSPPTQSASSVRVTLDKVHDRWLISQFDPV